MIAFFTGLWGKLLPNLIIIGSVALALLGAYAAVRKSGRDAERAAQLKEGLDRIKKANDAAAKVDNSPGGIADDPNNLDRVR